MKEIVIAAEGLAKTYLIYSSPARRLWQMLWRGRRSFYTAFEALKPVSFTIRQGETVGIIGRNGSGKSTLLQLLAGTLTPTSGTLQQRGKIAALLELGAGFNPEFTGRENLFLNASILGMAPPEIAAAYEDIVAFAAIGDFIDRPVSTYSNGMVVRLAFAVATAVQPDILIVDEALSVGDEAFQRKCFARIEKMRENGTTVLFVSHSAQTIVQLCDRAIWLDKGTLQMDGDPKTVIEAYHRQLHLTESASSEANLQLNVEGLAEATSLLQLSEARQEYPPAGGAIINPLLLSEEGEAVCSLEHGRRYLFRYEVIMTQKASNLRCGMLIKTRTGIETAGAVLHLTEHQKPQVAVGERLHIEFSFTCLLYPGQYFLNCGVVGDIEGKECYVHRLVDAFLLPVVNPSRRNAGGISPEGLVDLNFAGKLRS